MKYEVTLRRKRYDFLTVTVEAEDEEGAGEEAYEAASTASPSDWRGGQCLDICVEDVTPYPADSPSEKTEKDEVSDGQ